jgi:hypothetical protein
MTNWLRACALFSVAVLGCGESSDGAPVLATGAAAVCDPQRPIVLDLPRDGGFILNSEPLDSLGLASWFRAGLPITPRGASTSAAGSPRVVMVRAAEGREGQLRWIVPAIHASGGSAFAFDSLCAPPVRSFGSVPPAV